MFLIRQKGSGGIALETWAVARDTISGYAWGLDVEDNIADKRNPDMKGSRLWRKNYGLPERETFDSLSYEPYGASN